MDKAPGKVTKDPKRVEAARKGRDKYMNKLKKSILNEGKKRTGDTTNASNETTSAINSTTIRSDDTYVFGVAILSLVVIDVCVFLIFQAKNKNLVNKKQDQPPLRLLIFKKPI